LVNGKDASLYFKHEPGKHCIQRVPPTERGSRSHTSIISVAVLPILEYTDIHLNPDDLEIQATKGSGPGGQHRNVTDSAIRVRHKPTKLTVFIDGRCQHQNKKKALKILTARVNAQQQEKSQSSYNAKRQSQLGGGGRSNKVRTYNFIKQQRVVDHRLNTKTKRVDDVMKGNFELLFPAKSV